MNTPKELVRKYLPLFVLFVAFLMASWSLFKQGFIPTHDGEYHIIRFFEFEKMIFSGHFFPRWAPGLNSGYGVPIFNFYYPLPNYIGVLFHFLGFSLVDSFKLSLAAGYFIATMFCFSWLKKLFGEKEAVVGTTVFMYIPYWFVDIYVRGSIGEVFAIAFFMLTFASIENKWRIITPIAIFALIVSHNILAMLFMPIIAIYLYIKKYSFQPIILGILLSTYFWLPALFERQYVSGLSSVNYSDYFPYVYELLIPSWGAGLAGKSDISTHMSHQIGIVPLCIIFISTVLYILDKNRKEKRIILFTIIGSFILFFLMLRISLFIWRTIAVLQLLQYPWRLLSCYIPIAGILTAYIVYRIPKLPFSICLVIFAVGATYTYSRPVMYGVRDDEYYLSRTNFTDGTSSLGNSFSTKWMSWQSKRFSERLEVLSGKINILSKDEREISFRYDIVAETESLLEANVAYYPGWVVEIDKKKKEIDYNTNGKIRFSVPEGKHAMNIEFRETGFRKFADALSLAGLFWLFGSAILAYVRNKSHGK